MAYISKFSVIGCAFVRRPIAEAPAEGTIAIIDNGEGGGWTDRTTGKFEGGVWLTPSGKNPHFVPAFWSVPEGWSGG